MMSHPSLRLLTGFCGALVFGLATPADAQAPAPSSGKAATSQAQATRPDQAILQALAENPVTAPYRFSIGFRDGRYVLMGRVGTKQVHDVAVRIATALGFPYTDQLVIDTGEVYRAAAATGPVAGQVGPIVASPYGLNGYIYPPPLFGRYDDPFFGLDPPAISYPPWWRSLAYRQVIDPTPAGPGAGPVPPFLDAPYSPDAFSQGPAAASPPPPGAPIPLADQPASVDAAGSPFPGGPIEMTINPLGIATLKGTVPTLADRIALGQRIAQTPGVSEVINLLTTRESEIPAPAPGPAPGNAAPPAGEPAPDAAPAPPPPPAPAPAEAGAREADDRAAIPVNGGGLQRRLAAAVARRPSLAGLPIKLSVREDQVILSGRVPTVYEAMLAYRAAQQTPGVREVIDRLEFVVPDREGKNPLLKKGRPEDVEPYLEAQIRRQVGDLAHVDRVRSLGDGLQVEGTLAREEDRGRLEAILRSMPVLRGFRLEPKFQPE